MSSFLDEFRDDIHAWTEGLWDEETGGFRMSAKVGVNVMTTTDVAWMRYAVNDPNILGSHREPWVRYLQKRQDSHTGLVRHDPGPAGQGHSDGHALWQTVRALSILGGTLPIFPRHLRPLVNPGVLRAWFDKVDWDGPDSNHHEVLGLAPLLAGLDDPKWAKAFYEKLVEQQNPETGCWPRPKVGISRTFAYTCLHRAAGLMPPHAEKIVDTMLSLQQPNGFWQEEPSFLTMDAAYLLVRLPGALEYRWEEAHKALRRLAPALAGHVHQHRERIAENPHRMQAICHTFSLLHEAFPKEYPSARPYRFDWDDASMYYCPVIAEDRP